MIFDSYYHLEFSLRADEAWIKRKERLVVTLDLQMMQPWWVFELGGTIDTYNYTQGREDRNLYAP